MPLIDLKVTEIANELAQATAEHFNTKQTSNWLIDNQAAIANYNYSVEIHGIFSDGLMSYISVNNKGI
ncbi:MAG: type II toxin-antitoxin system CcdA family antitoxin [Methylococcaceae bacterium]